MRPLNGLTIFLGLTLILFTSIVLIKRSEYPGQKHLSSIPITLLARNEGKIYHTDLENYLVGVVAAEMPIEFSFAALEAQAVAARTIAVGRLKRFGGRGCRYQGVDFSDDPSENQAWESVENLKPNGGLAHFQQYYDKYAGRF